MVDQWEWFWKRCNDDEDADGGDEMEQSSQDMPTIEGEIPIGENPHESHDRDHPLGDSTIDSMDGSTVDEETNDSQNDNNHFGGNLAGYVKWGASSRFGQFSNIWSLSFHKISWFQEFLSWGPHPWIEIIHTRLYAEFRLRVGSSGQ